jgi:hypothetical protein
MPLIVLGDSFWEGQERPATGPRMLEILAKNLRMQPVNLSAGSTGFVSYANNRPTFLERIRPPAEAWYVSKASTAGTFTLSVTYGGSTQTTSALAYNANATTIQTALDALSNMSGVPTYPLGEKWHVTGGDYGSSIVIMSRNVPGATLSIDASGITGSMMITGNYLGDLVRSVPKDANGNALPFVLLIPGSGNDTAYFNAGTYGSAVPDAINNVINAVKVNFPTAVPIMTGLIGNAGVGESVITSGAWANNQVILSAIRANPLPTIHGREAILPIYTAIGDPYTLNGSGSVAAPIPGTRSFMKSVTNAGHPTGLGMQYFAEFILNKLRNLLWGWSAS